jgi:hypothetical protein
MAGGQPLALLLLPLAALLLLQQPAVSWPLEHALKVHQHSHAHYTCH